MKIFWYGHSCFKITTKQAIIALDPFGKEVGLRPPRFQADIVTVSHDHYDHNNTSSLQGNPFVIDGPGEYELKGVAIQGVDSFHDQKQGKERGLNTIFVIEAEDLKVCHLGDFGQKELTNGQLDKLGQVDILMVPVGGVYTIDAEQAVNIINQIEPKIVIPMHYKIPKLKVKLKGLEEFLEEIGVKEEIVEQLIIKKKDLPKEETKLVIMKII